MCVHVYACMRVSLGGAAQEPNVPVTIGLSGLSIGSVSASGREEEAGWCGGVPGAEEAEPPQSHAVSPGRVCPGGSGPGGPQLSRSRHFSCRPAPTSRSGPIWALSARQGQATRGQPCSRAPAVDTCRMHKAPESCDLPKAQRKANWPWTLGGAQGWTRQPLVTIRARPRRLCSEGTAQAGPRETAAPGRRGRGAEAASPGGPAGLTLALSPAPAWGPPPGPGAPLGRVCVHVCTCTRVCVRVHI